MRTFIKNHLKTITRLLMIVLCFFCLVILPCPSNGEADLALQSGDPLREGLAGRVVNCMLQDSNGFLWFGTQNGLYRYNGYSLKLYSFNSGYSNQFVSDFITSLAEDNDQNLWIGTLAGGLFKLNLQTGEYTNFHHSPDNSASLNDNAIRAIYKDSSGILWIGLQNTGLDCLDPVNGYFVHYENIFDNASSNTSYTINSICQDKSGTLWIGTLGGGLVKFEPQTGQFLHIKNQLDAPGSLTGNNISGLYMDRTGVLWIVSENGSLRRLDTSSERLLVTDFRELRDIRVTAIAEDATGALWVGTYGNGVGMLDRDSGKFTARECDFPSHNSSRSYRVLYLYADNSGNLWIGTEDSGIDKINTNLNFSSYISNTDGGAVFSDDVILSLYKDETGVVWLGTANGGINRFDRENKRVDYFKNDPGDQNSISSNAVSSIFEDSKGSLWFGTIDGTINRLEQASRKFARYKIKLVDGSGYDNGIMMMHEGKNGIIWACAANGGLIGLDPNSGQYSQYINDAQRPDSISSNHVLAITEDGSGILWIGTAGGGLNRFDSSTGKFTHYSIEQSNSDTKMINYSVKAIVDDGEILWLATDKGLYQFYKASGKSVLKTDSQLNANTLIYSLLKDDQGNLWLSTTNGLIRYNRQNGYFYIYKFDGGLRINQYNAGTCSKSSDGEIFFGGTNGFNCFYPDQIKENTHRPPVVISDMKIFDQSSKLSNTGQVTLSYRDDFISFEFAALDYANPTKNQYAYMLEGFDRDWHYSGTRNYASYTNLDAGDYVLRVKAANNDGFWNEEGIQIKLSITPPFWETSWFIVLVIMLTLGLILAVIKQRTRTIKLRSIELEHQVAERTRELNRANESLRQADANKSSFLSMVSHEIRTPLSAIMGFTELITGKINQTILPHTDATDPKVKKAVQTISRDLNIIMSEEDRLATLVDSLLNISKIESGQIDWESEVLDLAKVVEQALAITKPLIEKAGLDIYVDIENGLPKIQGNKDMLTQAIINLLSNAVKFTNEGFIKLGVHNAGENILVAIQDTGAGIHPDNLQRIFDRFNRAKSLPGGGRNNSGMGLGLYICRDIIEKHGGKIWAESQPGKGSSFYFLLPVYLDRNNLL